MRIPRRAAGSGKGPRPAGVRGTGAAAPTEEAVAEAVPDAAGDVPHPAAPQAGHEGEADAADGHQEVAEADVDEEEIGGRAEPLELVVEHQHQQVVAHAQRADGGDEQRQQLVGAGAEERPLAGHLVPRRRGLRAARRPRAVPRVHGSTHAAARPERGRYPGRQEEEEEERSPPSRPRRARPSPPAWHLPGFALSLAAVSSPEAVSVTMSLALEMLHVFGLGEAAVRAGQTFQLCFRKT